jgi:predicted ATPase
MVETKTQQTEGDATPAAVAARIATTRISRMVTGCLPAAATTTPFTTLTTASTDVYAEDQPSSSSSSPRPRRINSLGILETVEIGKRSSRSCNSTITTATATATGDTCGDACGDGDDAAAATGGKLLLLRKVGSGTDLTTTATASSTSMNGGGGGVGGTTTTTTSTSSTNRNSSGSRSDTSKVASRASTTKLTYFATGREFYDDGYYSDKGGGGGDDTGESDDDDDDEDDVASLADKLNFSNIQVVKGRENKIQVLQDIYRHVQSKGFIQDNSKNKRMSNSKTRSKKEVDDDTPPTTCVAMIRGVSGAGKSTLVRQFIDTLAVVESNKSPRVVAIELKTATTGEAAGADASDGRPLPPTPVIGMFPHVLRGKYDELSGGDPFSAIVEAFNGFAMSLLSLDDDDDDNEQATQSSTGKSNSTELARIRKEIQIALGDEAHTLVRMIPNLRPVLLENIAATTMAGSTMSLIGDNTSPAAMVVPSGSKENAWNRLRYIFQVFTKAISTAQRPVIMFLDDLQWADTASLELIEALLTDVDLRYFMFVGAYRSDEVNDGDELLTCLERIDKVQKVAQIELVNLSIDELKEFVTHVLSKSGDDQEDDEAEDGNDHQKEEDDGNSEIQALVEVLHLKTGGNIFFAMQVLEDLQRKGTLLFSRMTFQWECNLQHVNLDDLLSDDLIATITSKINRAPELLQRALILAAYTRSTVDLSTLQQLLEWDGHFVETTELESLLDKAVIDGLLSNSTGSKSYSFAHDRIQEASYAKIPAGSVRNEFRFQMGRRLYDLGTTSNKGDDWMLYAAADHLNASATMHLPRMEDDPLYLTKLNLNVGERAMSNAAYEIASKFLGCAMTSLLQSVKDPWESHYDITLQLYQAIAAVEFCQGHFEMGSGIASRVLEHAKTCEEKLPTQIALAKALGRERQHRDSFELSTAALRELREYPKGLLNFPVTLIKDFLSVSRYFKKHSDEEILNLPLCNDMTKASILELHNSLAYQSYMCGKMIDFVGTTLKQLRLTFEHGICPDSPVSLAWYCLVLDSTNDMESVYRVKSLACQILERTKAKEHEGLTLFLITYFIGTWKEPFNEVIALYQRAGKSSMESGDFENGLLNMMASNYFQFLCGYPLVQLDIKYANLDEKMIMYRIESMHCMSIEMWRLIQHLRGSSKAPLDFAELEKFGFDKTDGSENYKVLYGYMTRAQLGVYFGNNLFAQKAMELLAQTDLVDGSYPVKTVQLFFGSLIYSTRARETKKRSYLKKAKKFSREFKWFCKNKGMNGWHRYLLAEAHRRASRGNSDPSVRASFDSAIGAAMNSGHNQDAALGAQLAAEYFLSIRETNTLNSPGISLVRDSLVRHYLVQARDLYLDWGARGMVRHLEKIHNDWLSPSAVVQDERSSVVSYDQQTFNSSKASTGPSVPNSVSNRSGVLKCEMSVMTDNDWRSAAGERSSPKTLREGVGAGKNHVMQECSP